MVTHLSTNWLQHRITWVDLLKAVITKPNCQPKSYKARYHNVTQSRTWYTQCRDEEQTQTKAFQTLPKVCTGRVNHHRFAASDNYHIWKQHQCNCNDMAQSDSTVTANASCSWSHDYTVITTTANASYRTILTICTVQLTTNITTFSFHFISTVASGWDGTP